MITWMSIILIIRYTNMPTSSEILSVTKVTTNSTYLVLSNTRRFGKKCSRGLKLSIAKSQIKANLND